MKYARLVLRNLSRNLRRTALTIFAIALAVFTHSTLASLPFLAAHLVSSPNSERRLVAMNKSGFFYPLPAAYRRKIQAIPHRVAYVGEGQNRLAAVHVSDAVRLFRLALEKGQAGTRYHAVGEEGVAMRDIAEVIGAGLKMPIESITPEEAPEYFGWLANLVTIDLAASSALTRGRPAREDHETLTQIIELGGDAVGIADPVAVRIEKRSWIDLIEDTTLPSLERQPARFSIRHRDRVACDAPAVAQPVEKSRRKCAMRVLFVKRQIGFGQHIAPSLVRALMEKCLVAASE